MVLKPTPNFLIPFLVTKAVGLKMLAKHVKLKYHLVQPSCHNDYIWWLPDILLKVYYLYHLINMKINEASCAALKH